jgi:hypothetical protein
MEYLVIKLEDIRVKENIIKFEESFFADWKWTVNCWRTYAGRSDKSFKYGVE